MEGMMGRLSSAGVEGEQGQVGGRMEKVHESKTGG